MSAAIEQVPVNVWLPSSAKRIFDVSLIGRRFKVKKEYNTGTKKMFTNIISTSTPRVMFGDRSFKEWLLLPEK